MDLEPKISCFSSTVNTGNRDNDRFSFLLFSSIIVFINGGYPPIYIGLANNPNCKIFSNLFYMHIVF